MANINQRTLADGRARYRVTSRLTGSDACEREGRGRPFSVGRR